MNRIHFVILHKVRTLPIKMQPQLAATSQRPRNQKTVMKSSCESRRLCANNHLLCILVNSKNCPVWSFNVPKNLNAIQRKFD